MGCGMADPFEIAWMVLKAWNPYSDIQDNIETAGAQLEAERLAAAQERLETAREMDQFYFWNPYLAEVAGIDPTPAITTIPERQDMNWNTLQ